MAIFNAREIGLAVREIGIGLASAEHIEQSDVGRRC